MDAFCEVKILYDLTPQKSRNKLYMFAEYIEILNKGTELIVEDASTSNTLENVGK